MSVAADMQFHPVAGLFPLMEEADLQRLTDDIRENGIREPIWLHPDGSILDGRNRFRACERAGVDPVFQTWSGDGSPVSFVVSLNLHRRHLDSSQRAMVADRIATMRQGERTDLSENSERFSQADAAELMNVSTDLAGYARKVRQDGAPALVEAVDRGEVAVSAAAALTQLEPEDQATVVALPPEERREAIREVREGQIPHVARNSGNNEWYTPEIYVKAAKQVLGTIDLDPASSEAANKVVKAKQFYSADDDGLALSWKGTVWMNPPYAQPLCAQFCERLAKAVEDKSVPAAVVLVNNATETQWFRDLADVASAICFPTGRIKFWSPDKESATPLQGQALIYIGPKWATFAAVFSHMGIIWRKA